MGVVRNYYPFFMENLMGLFSTKKKTVVNADLSPLVDEKDRDTYGQRGLYKYIFDRERSISMPQRMLDEYAVSLPMRFENAYRYSLRQSYAIGAPRLAVAPVRNTLDYVVRDHLIRHYNSQEPLAAVVKYTQVSEPHLHHYAWVKLQEQYGYNLDTNELEFLSTDKGFPVYLESFQVNVGTVTQQEVEIQDYLTPIGLSQEWGYTPERTADRDRALLPFVLSTTDTLDFTNVQYIWQETHTETRTEESTEIQTITEIDPETQEEVTREVEVPVTNEVEVEVTTTHRDSLVLTYEDVIPPPAEEGMPVDIEGNYVQVMYSIYDKWYTYEYRLYTDEDPVFERALLGTSSEADFYPGLYARIDLENLYEREKSDPVRKSLVNLGKQLKLDWVEWSTSLVEQMETPSQIRDALITTVCPMASEDQVAAKYGYHFLQSLVIDAEDLGPYDKAWNTQPSTVTGSRYFKLNNFTVADSIFTYTFKCSYLMILEHVGSKCPVGKYVAEKNPTNDAATVRALGAKFDSYFFQLDSGNFREIRIYGAITTYTVNSRQTDEAVFPLKRSIVRNNFKSHEREQLFYVSTYVYIGTSVVIKTKWYQRGAFKAVMAIVTIAVGVVTGGVGAAALATWQTALQAVAIAAVQSIAVSVIISVLARVLVSVGVDAQIITAVAVVVLVAAGYVAAGGKIGELSALQLIAMSNEAFAISQNMFGLQLAQVQKSMLNLTHEFEQKLEEISNLQDSIGLLSPDMLLEISNAFYASRLGETVEQYHYRTMDMDITELTHKQISDYVAMMTELPDFHELVNLMRRNLNG